MTKQITLKEALELVTFHQNDEGAWCVSDVFDDVHGDVFGDVHGNVFGNVLGDVEGDVHGTISDQKWQFIETPKEKFSRLLAETNNQKLIDAFNRLEDN